MGMIDNDNDEELNCDENRGDGTVEELLSYFNHSRSTQDNEELFCIKPGLQAYLNGVEITYVIHTTDTNKWYVHPRHVLFPGILGAIEVKEKIF